MAARSFTHRSVLPASAAEVFRWHETPGAFERLAPPWQDVRLIDRTGGLDDGGRVELSLATPLGRRRWVAEHRDYHRGQWFRDVQVEGPFRSFEHTHRTEDVREPGAPLRCALSDEIEYELPLPALSHPLAGGLVDRDLRRAFTYRHDVLRDDLTLFDEVGRPPSGRILVTGASGLVGSALVPLLRTAGHEVVRAVRRPPRGPDEIQWDPEKGKIALADLDGLDGIVHLAGAGIAEKRWSEARKSAIRDSRVNGTMLLANRLTELDRPPPVLVSASAIGVYGERGDEIVDENSDPGDGFLAQVGKAWEVATLSAEQAGIRVVRVRIGIVLSPAGGALAKMLTPFRMGAGGVVGPGTQYMSWISLDDLLGVLFRALHDETVRGPLNAVAPDPVTNRRFTSTLGAVLRRPTIAPLPAFAVRMLFGEMGENLLLGSTRVVPTHLEGLGHTFRHPRLEDALRHVLGRPDVG